MKLILFLGAGVSVPSGLPTADELTRLIYGSENRRKSQFGSGPANMTNTRIKDPEEVARIRRLLCLLKNHDERDIERVGYIPSAKKSSGAIFRGSTSYEDLFYLCQEMEYWSDGRVDNSLVTPLMEVIERKASGFLVGRSVLARMSDLGLLAGKACVYIESVVAGILNTSKLLGFDLIKELANSPDVERLNIVTLNHDTLVERLLADQGIPFIDGFGPPDGELRWYDDKTYDSDRSRIRMIKLHGSVNWYSLVVDGAMKTVLLRGTDLADIKDGQGKVLKIEFQRPLFLSGLNKAVSYQRGIYSDMNFRFHQCLRDCDRMVMSGYGWGDAAINLRLDTWIDQSRRNTLILLHSRPKELTNRSAIIAGGYDPWIRRSQLIPITKWLSDTTLDDLKSHLKVESSSS